MVQTERKEINIAWACDLETGTMQQTNTGVNRRNMRDYHHATLNSDIPNKHHFTHKIKQQQQQTNNVSMANSGNDDATSAAVTTTTDSKRLYSNARHTRLASRSSARLPAMPDTRDWLVGLPPSSRRKSRLHLTAL